MSFEALKWLALILMVLDHVNKYFFYEKLLFIFEAGRTVMPLFVMVLANNLAREGSLERGVYIRTMKRLAVFGIFSTPAFIGLGGLAWGWWPLNIMFTLFFMTLIIFFLDKKKYVLAMTVFFIGGSSVEFWWPALTLGVSVWQYKKTSHIGLLIVAILSIASLKLINGNYWALASIPILMMVRYTPIPQIPRSKWLFYYFYPLHLTIIWAIINFRITI